MQARVYSMNLEILSYKNITVRNLCHEESICGTLIAPFHEWNLKLLLSITIKDGCSTSNNSSFMSLISKIISKLECIKLIIKSIDVTTYVFNMVESSRTFYHLIIPLPNLYKN